MGNPFLDHIPDLLPLDSCNCVDESVVAASKQGNHIKVPQNNLDRHRDGDLRKCFAYEMFYHLPSQTLASSELLTCIEQPGQPEPPSTYDCKVLDVLCIACKSEMILNVLSSVVGLNSKMSSSSTRRKGKY